MRYLSLLFIVFSQVLVNGQINYPRVSPLTTVEQQIGLAKIELVYSRPAVRGRKIIGDLVPYGRIWRVGANESTKITVDKQVMIQGETLDPGTYALYAFPEQDIWEIALHSNTSHWGDGRDAYNADEDVFRIEVVPETMKEIRENFLIYFDRIDHNSAYMIWEWEYTRIRIPIEVDTGSMMQDEILKQIQLNPTAQTYYEAARYLQEQNTDLPRALDYVNKALEIGGDTYYFHRVKSLLEASQGNYKQAVESASKSLEISQSLGKDEFVRMNQKNIDKWKEIINSDKQ